MDTGDQIPPSLPLQKREIPPLWQRGVRGDSRENMSFNYGLLNESHSMVLRGCFARGSLYPPKGDPLSSQHASWSTIPTLKYSLFPIKIQGSPHLLLMGLLQEFCNPILSLIKEVSMRCHRCGGIMVYEKFYGPHEQFFGWRCIFCGEIVDEVILENRFAQRVG